MKTSKNYLFLLVLGLIFLKLSFLKENSSEKNVLYKPEFFYEKVSLENLQNTKFTPEVFTNSKFYYLGQGLQSVAFESADKKYVLKFFIKQKIRFGSDLFKSKIKSYLYSLGHKKREKKQEKKLRKLSELVSNYLLYFEKLPEHSTVLMVHACPDNVILPKVELIDPTQKTHIVDLNSVAFVIQKKAELFTDVMNRLSVEKRIEYAKIMNDFLEKRAVHGFTDIKRTMSMEKNYGFIGDLPVQFDIGNVIFKQEILNQPSQEIFEIQKEFQKWILANT